jgi:hypothetical protein
MSEYKFACPECGQHMMCDASHGGSVMECPTCFQKIVAPQAPAPDAKFILTGSKFVEKTIPASLANAASRLKSPAGKSFPIGLFLLILVLLAGAGGYFFRDKIARMIAGGEWRGTDIGEVGAAGSFSRSHGVFTINGSGADTWNREDSFQFVHQPVNGDGVLTAHVLSLKNTDEWAKAGVMFRETTNAGSMFALAAVRPDGQVQFVWRNGNGRIAASSQLAGGMGYPKWVRIARKGNTFTAYYKVNAADEWQQLGTTQKMKMPKQAQTGLVVCAHHAGVLSEAKLDNVTLEAGNPAAAK